MSDGARMGDAEKLDITTEENPIISIGNTVANSLSDGARMGDAKKSSISLLKKILLFRVEIQWRTHCLMVLEWVMLKKARYHY